MKVGLQIFGHRSEKTVKYGKYSVNATHSSIEEAGDVTSSLFTVL